MSADREKKRLDNDAITFINNLGMLWCVRVRRVSKIQLTCTREKETQKGFKINVGYANNNIKADLTFK